MLKKKTNCTSIVSESPCLTYDCFWVEVLIGFLSPLLSYGGGCVGQARIWKLLGALNLLGGRKLADV